MRERARRIFTRVEIDEGKFLNSNTFCLAIERLVRTKHKDSSSPYIDAIVEYCDANDLEISLVAQLINTRIEANLREEGVALNYMKQKTKTAKLF